MGISAMKKRNQTIYLGATNIPMLNADIVTGISMMLLFVKFMNLGFVTVLIAHITFNIPYVILNVLPKLKQTNKYTYEAALDLGASPLYAFFKVTWPEISPGVFSGFMMAVTKPRFMNFTNKSIIEIPVTISALRIGMFVAPR